MNCAKIGKMNIYRGVVQEYERGVQESRFYAVKRGPVKAIFTRRSAALATKPRRMQGFETLYDAYRYLGGK